MRLLAGQESRTCLAVVRTQNQGRCCRRRGLALRWCLACCRRCAIDCYLLHLLHTLVGSSHYHCPCQNKDRPRGIPSQVMCACSTACRPQCRLRRHTRRSFHRCNNRCPARSTAHSLAFPPHLLLLQLLLPKKKKTRGKGKGKQGAMASAAAAPSRTLAALLRVPFSAAIGRVAPASLCVSCVQSSPFMDKSRRRGGSVIIDAIVCG